MNYDDERISRILTTVGIMCCAIATALIIPLAILIILTYGK